MKSLLDPTFVYVNAASTDLRKSFARVRRELRAKADAEAKQRAQDEANTAAVVRTFDRRREQTKP